MAGGRDAMAEAERMDFDDDTGNGNGIEPLIGADSWPPEDRDGVGAGGGDDHRDGDPRDVAAGDDQEQNMTAVDTKVDMVEDKPPTEEIEEVMDGDFLEPKRIPLVGEKVQRDTLHLYGLDVITTEEILEHLREGNPKRVLWINDSSCNVLFEDERPLQALIGYTEDTPEDDVAPVKDDVRFQFKELVPFTKMSKRIHLYGRMATEGDKRPEKPSKYSAWSRTVQAKGDLRGRLNRVRAGLTAPDQPEDLREMLSRQQVAKQFRRTGGEGGVRGGRRSGRRGRGGGAPGGRVVIETDRYRLTKSKTIKK